MDSSYAVSLIRWTLGPSADPTQASLAVIASSSLPLPVLPFVYPFVVELLDVGRLLFLVHVIRTVSHLPCLLCVLHPPPVSVLPIHHYQLPSVLLILLPLSLLSTCNLDHITWPPNIYDQSPSPLSCLRRWHDHKDVMATRYMCPSSLHQAQFMSLSPTWYYFISSIMSSQTPQSHTIKPSVHPAIAIPIILSLHFSGLEHIPFSTPRSTISIRYMVWRLPPHDNTETCICLRSSWPNGCYTIHSVSV